jgi:DNA-binding Xre family transcriptional regulator
MSISEQQKPAKELLSEIADQINIFLGQNYIYEITEKAGISNPIITALRKGETDNISLTTLMKICNAIGFTIDEIKISKLEK